MTEIGVGMMLLSLVMSVLTGANAYWLRRFIHKVDEINGAMENIKIAEAGSRASCVEKHIGINARLRKHEEDILSLSKVQEKHNTDIAILHTKISKK